MCSAKFRTDCTLHDPVWQVPGERDASLLDFETFLDTNEFPDKQWHNQYFPRETLAPRTTIAMAVIFASDIPVYGLV